MKDDLQLQQRVIDELEFDPGVNAAHIGVSVRDGVVTLSGHVESFFEKHEAERAARRIRGVKAVAQELLVHLPSDRKTEDDEIAARAVKILSWDALVPDERISVQVEHGVVMLSGEVEWNYQRQEAEYDVRKLGGIKTIVNNITVKPMVRAEDVQTKIRAALERSAIVQASRITVDVSGNTVTLGGTAPGWTERQAAERAAWSVAGVTQVEDRIELARL
ncbi:MAG TPA: BON domain-containing protein [Aliidongia sp.]|nr:BON domain-containing protein [Aliidongia sp.]